MIVASPVYNASLSGILKAMLDLLPPRNLQRPTRIASDT
ncbi:MAG: NAD(P)H-dependent oxidoreductase [Sporolactobacillus sp.]